MSYPTFYRVFKRSCTSWETFGRSRKMTEATGLTADQAREMCKAFNESRSKSQIRRGTCFEFEAM